MGRTAIAALLVLLGAGAGAAAASAHCTMAERLKMFEGGLSAPRVAELCGDNESSGREPKSFGNDVQVPSPPAPFPASMPPPPLLITRFGARALHAAVSVPVGAPCRCFGPLGPAPGQAR